MKCEACGQEIERREKTAINDIRRVVTVFKMAQGFDKEDKSWDKMFFGRYMRAAKSLIDFLGGWEQAADCVQEIHERLSGMGLTVTFETILKHSADWKKNHCEKTEKKPEIRVLPKIGIA